MSPESAALAPGRVWMRRYLALTLVIFLGAFVSLGGFFYFLQRGMGERQAGFTLGAELIEERLRAAILRHARAVSTVAATVAVEPKTFVPVGDLLVEGSDFTSILSMQESRSGLSIGDSVPLVGDGKLPVEVPEQVAGIAVQLKQLEPGRLFFLPMSNSRLLIAAAVESGKSRRYILGTVNVGRMIERVLDARQSVETSLYLYSRKDDADVPIAAWEHSNLFDFVSTQGQQRTPDELQRFAAFDYTREIDLLGERFKLVVLPTPAFLAGATGTYPWIVLAFGGVLTVLAGMLVFSLLGKQLEIRTIVSRRTRELREKAAELQEARDRAEEASNAKSEFLANMSHEIRTPLNAITGLVQILSTSNPLTPQQRTYIQHVQSSAQALFELISDILDLSKIESRDFALEYAPFPLSQMMRELEQMLSHRAREKNLSLVLDASSIDGVQYLGDKARLRQVLINLVNNALKFTEKGSVTLRTYVRGVDDKLLIEVSDTGIGIPTDKQKIVFEKFSQADQSITRRFGGTGLGLHISRQLVGLMGGELTLSSEPGFGSTFTIALPLRLVNAQIPTMGQRATDAPPVDPRHGRILLVEDFDSNVMVASLMLKELGYECEVATNGRNAIERFEPGRFDAVLMDVQMPEMDGIEATKRLRDYEREHELPQTPIIGLTAHAIAEYRDRCYAAGMNDFITKPFTLEELKRRLGTFEAGLAA